MEGAEQVLRVDRGVVRGAPGGDQDDVEVATGQRVGDAPHLREPVLEEAGRDLGLLEDLVPQAHTGTSRASCGAAHTSSPRDDRADGVEVPGQDREVGPGARRDAAAVGQAQQAGGHGRRRGEGRLDTPSRGRGQVPDAGVEPQDASREQSVGQPRAGVVDGHLAVGQPERTVRHPERGHRIGHDREPVGPGDPPGNVEHRRVHVDRVGDRPHCDPFVGEDRRGDPRLAMGHRRHRVEQVRGVAGARLDPGLGLLEGRARVPERDDDTFGREHPDELERARQVGRERDDRDTGRPAPAGCQSGVGPAKERRVVRAIAVGAQERALEMQPQRYCPAVAGRRPLLEDGQRLLDASGGRGDDRRQEGCDPGRGDRLAHGPDGGRVVRGVVASRAVDLEVDQAGGQQQSVELDAPCRTRGGVLAKGDDAPSCRHTLVGGPTPTPGSTPGLHAGRRLGHNP